MKAIRIHGPKDARYEDVPMPEIGPDNVLVRVRAVGICATDVELYDGVMFYITSGITKYPFIPGHEWSGEVVETGCNVTEFAVGDRVVGECSVGCRQCSQCRRGWYHICPNRAETGLLKQAGGFAEYISFPRFFLHKCDGLTYEDAAFTEPTGVAINPVKSARVTPDDCVAIIGVGPIGLLTVQVARAYGARKVIAVDVDDARLAVARQLGSDETINARRDDVRQRVREATDGHLVDVLVECSGQPAAWENVVLITAPGARICLVGLFAGQTCKVDFDHFTVNNMTIIGCLGGPNMWGEAIALLASGKVRATPLITHRLPLSQFVEGVEISRRRKDNAIKVVLEP
ncbi:MAG: zinc-binding dehydrogenase [Armatimonadetes bacterium]|nr:zinc-binding dehydrogenase [Armatimonadota bacterium]